MPKKPQASGRRKPGSRPTSCSKERTQKRPLRRSKKPGRLQEQPPDQQLHRRLPRDVGSRRPAIVFGVLPIEFSNCTLFVDPARLNNAVDKTVLIPYTALVMRYLSDF